VFTEIRMEQFFAGTIPHQKKYVDAAKNSKDAVALYGVGTFCTGIAFFEQFFESSQCNF
jgi:hypothetical protein